MFPMGMVSPRMTQGRWKSRLFLTSTIRIVPADVGCIWVDGCAAGGGGGGGYDGEGGGGGAGGMCGDAISKVIMPVIPLETLTLIIGAAGLGGAKGNAGTDGGYTQISGSQRTLTLRPSYAGGSGTVSAGGVGVGFPNTGSSTVNLQFLPGGYGYPFQEIPAAISASGGGPSSNGGSNYSVVNGLGFQTIREVAQGTQQEVVAVVEVIIFFLALWRAVVMGDRQEPMPRVMAVAVVAVEVMRRVEMDRQGLSAFTVSQPTRFDYALRD